MIHNSNLLTIKKELFDITYVFTLSRLTSYNKKNAPKKGRSICYTKIFYFLIFGSSRPNPCFLSTRFKIIPMKNAATPKHASITSGQV